MTLIDTNDLTQRAKKWQISLSAAQVDQFDHFAALLDQWNQKMNLTAVPVSNYVERHFLDSLSLATIAEWKDDASIIDIGTGAGFPGIPLKIAFPKLKLTLLESMKKRCVFLEVAISELNLTDVRVVTQRAETEAHIKISREGFDIVTARAVADLSILSELLIPFARRGGVIAPIKGEHLTEETNRAKEIATLCGATFLRIDERNIPDSNRTLSIPIFEKSASTPKQFPRPYSVMSKKRS